MSRNKILIIGLPPQGFSTLNPGLKRRVSNAEILFCGNRFFKGLPTIQGKIHIIGDNLDEFITIIKSNIGHKRIVILASGDPNFFGIARYLVSKLGKNAIEIIPSISSMQIAFARIKESWDDAVFLSVHSRPIGKIIETVSANNKICLLTDEKNNPIEIARILRQSGITNRRVYVCQDLGSDKEKIIRTNLLNVENSKYSPLNIMIIIRDDNKYTMGHPVFGLSDDYFKRRNANKSLITKLEIRAVSLARLSLNEESTIWDIGAGTGAVSIEAASLSRKGQVIAIEKNEADVRVIKENIRRSGKHNIKVIHSTAPDGLENIPDPTAVFIGGSGGNLDGILKLVSKRLKNGGRVVINIATIDRLQAACNELKINGFSSDVTLLNVARSKAVLDLTRFESLNPVFVITGYRELEKEKTRRH
jgi:precorrin-6B C5,15-methyltransferase / cobalt-precorrin-6B C5,C15-methyltransferase